MRAPLQGMMLLLLLTAASGACATRTPARDEHAARALLQTPAPLLQKRVVARHGVASSAHPLASDAGIAMLRRGGNAVDAAVAIGFALNVVEPMMSGVGGGGGMLIWLQQQRRAEYVDFYSAARAVSYRGTLPDTGRASLRDVAVPGAVAGFLDAHERYGRLPLADVLAPAIQLAEDGFPVYVVLHEAIASNRAKLERFPEAARRFLPAGEPLPVGATLRQPELGATLRRIAAHGRAGFYDGETAAALVATLRAGGNPTSLADLAAYRPQWDKRPLCTTYRGHIVLSAPPPQTGMRVLQALNLLEAHDLRALGLPTQSSEALDVLASALRVAQVDHSRHNNDPNWEVVPAAGVASKAFARTRAALVGASPVPERVAAGAASPFDREPPPAACAALEPYGPAPAIRSDGAAGSAAPAPAILVGAAVEDVAGADGAAVAGETTHLSVVDADGNAVALSNTLSPYFGSGAWVDGYFLNSSAVSFSSDAARAPARSEWRVRSSTIAPTIVLANDGVRAVIGSPGGGRIPGAVLQGLVYMLDYGLDPLEAVAMPRILTSGATRSIEIEQGYPADVLADLRRRGWQPRPQTPGYARLYAVARMGDVWVGAADPRHDGAVRGY